MKEKTSIIVFMPLDFTECDRARMTRDPTYDGRFYTGVHTTRCLLPAGLSRASGALGQCFILPVGRGGRGGRFPPVPKVPARDCSVL